MIGGDKMRFRIRRAKISPQMRDDFERYGAQVIALALGLGSLTPQSGQFPTHALQTVVLHQSEAADWLREKRDEEMCDKRRTELVEWSILIFVIFGVVLDFLILKHSIH
jgi:hypothetical protein